MKQTIFLLLLIVLLGTFFRFYMIGAESFWVDEAGTAITVKKYSTKEIFYNTYVIGNILPNYFPKYFITNLDLPLYYILLKIWANMFGISEVSLRIFSAIFGSLSIAVVYLLSKELFNTRVGLISALIFSLNIIMIEYSQEARLYSFLIFFVLLSSYSLIKFLKTNKNKHLTAFVLANIIGIYTSPIFLFFFIFEIVYIMYLTIIDIIKKEKITIKKIHISFLIFFIAYLPLLRRFLNPEIEGSRYIGTMSFDKLAKIFLQYHSWLYTPSELAYKINNSQFHLFTLSDWLMIIPVILIVVLLFTFFIKSFFMIKNREKNSFIFCILSLVIPFAISFFVLYDIISVFASNRYIIYTIPAYLILASFGMSKNKNLYILITLFSILSVAPLVSYYSNPDHPHYNKAVLFLEENITDKDVIILNVQSIKLAFDYYSKRLNNVYGAPYLEDVIELTKKRSSVWLVLSTKYADQQRLIKRYFDYNYKLIETKEFVGVILFHYEKNEFN